MLGRTTKKRLYILSTLITGLAATGLLAIRAQEPAVQNQRAEGASTTDHSDCLMFGAQRERYANQALRSLRMNQLTEQVSAARAAGMGMTATTMSASPSISAPGGSRTSSADTSSANLIDGYIFPALKAN